MRGSGVRILFAAPTLKIFAARRSATDRSTVPHSNPDRQQDGSTNRRSRLDRPQADPEGARRAAPSNPLCGTDFDRSVPGTSFTDYSGGIVNTFAAKGLGPRTWMW